MLKSFNLSSKIVNILNHELRALKLSVLLKLFIWHILKIHPPNSKEIEQDSHNYFDKYQAADGIIFKQLWQIKC